MMNFTQDEIAAIIGTKELEIIALRRELAKIREEKSLTEAPKPSQQKAPT